MNHYCADPDEDDPDCDCLLDLLDGEGVLVNDGLCFSHNIFFNNKCIECENEG